MGAYENPNSATHSARMSQIAQQQQTYITGMIKGIGVNAANIINSKRERQTDDFNKTQDRENKSELKLLGLKDKARENASKSGISSDSFFQMSYGNIDETDKWETILGSATDVKTRQEASYQLDMANKRSSKVDQYIRGYKDWIGTYTEEISGTNRNSPGGLYTGNPDGSDFDKATYKNWALKNALMGAQLSKDGNGLLPPVEFYQKEDGTVMGKLKGYDDFDIMTTINTPPVHVMDLKKGLIKEFDAQGLKEKGEFKRDLLNFKDPEIGPGVKTINSKNVAMITKQIPFHTSVIQAWTKKADLKLAGILAAMDGEADFNDMQATYLSIAGKSKKYDKDQDGEIDIDPETGKPFEIEGLKMKKGTAKSPLNFKNGFYQLDKKSEIMFREAYLENAVSDFLGNGYVEIKEFAEVQPTSKQLMSKETKVKKEAALTLFDNAFKDNNFEFMRGYQFAGQKVKAVAKDDLTNEMVFLNAKNEVIGYPNLNKPIELEEMLDSYISEKYSDVGQSQRNAMKMDLIQDIKYLKDLGKKRSDEKENKYNQFKTTRDKAMNLLPN